MQVDALDTIQAGETTETYTGEKLPQFKELKQVADRTTAKADKEEPILGLDPSNKDNQTKIPLKTIDQLLIHNSDTAVKPIIGNKDIEKPGELIFNAS